MRSTGLFVLLEQASHLFNFKHKNMEKFLFFLLCHVLLSYFQKISYAADTVTPTESFTYGQELVSSGGSFVLGFFNPGSSQTRYLGIWYKNIMPRVIVWVANRENPLNDTKGHLRIGAQGNLVLLDGSGNQIWSTPLQRAIKDPIAKLLDSGNLVLVDGRYGSYAWQSFDYPTDTLVEGMMIGWDAKTGLNRILTSWKTDNDPSVGNFTYSFDHSAIPQLLHHEGLKILTRSGIWNGIEFNHANWKPSTAINCVITVNDHEVSYRALLGYMLTRFVVHSNGSARGYLWNNQTMEWIVFYEATKDICDQYGYCGQNGICNFDNWPFYCQCLKGFVPKSQEEWNRFNWESGCTRRTPLNCSNMDAFVKLSNVKMPNLLHFWTNNTMSLEDCRVECIKNCSCTAYANSGMDGGPHGCLLWFEDLIDTKQLANGAAGQDLYVKVASSEVDSVDGASKRRKLVMVSLITSVPLGIIFLFLFFYLIKKKKQQMETVGAGNRSQNEEAFPLFDIATILAATGNFCSENKIGQGGFGPVYKGILPEGQEIAVKRLSKTSMQGNSEFMNEVLLVAKLQHRNLVKVLGGCIQGGEKMLVYEYLPNQSLDNFIFDPIQSIIMDWRKRHDIVVGIARGLMYLHQDSRLTIIHRDLKASNILLDSEFNPKISDFGLAQISNGGDYAVKTRTIVGTYGYMSPEYAIHGLFSVKSDIFSFGVIVLEILSGIKNKDFNTPDHHHNLLGHAWMLWNEGRALEFMDANLDHPSVTSQLLRCMQVGLLCVQNLPTDRPTMSSVVFMLSYESVMLPEPKEPGFFGGNMESQEESWSNNDMTISLLEARM